MTDRIPTLSPNLPPVSCMVWNIQGTRNKNKVNALKEVVNRYKPSILALIETHMDGTHAENIRGILGYSGHSRSNPIISSLLLKLLVGVICLGSSLLFMLVPIPKIVKNFGLNWSALHFIIIILGC
ncbi:hypothetical protein vseg_015196 [Gypsophila vaccaria]